MRGGGGGGGGGSESEVGMLMKTALPQAQESQTQSPDFPGDLQGVGKMWKQRALACELGDCHVLLGATSCVTIEKSSPVK